MSAPAVKRTIYDDAVEVELEKWHGVSWRREVRSKHYALILNFGDVSRFVIYPCSPGDSTRGQLNHLTDVRHALRDIGATRATAKRADPGKQRSTAPKAAQVRVQPKRDTPTRLADDPFAGLAGLVITSQPQPSAKPKMSWWRRLIAKAFA